MMDADVVCYFCGYGASAAYRRKLCPKCGSRLPGVPSGFALGDKPKDSLRGLIVWGWVFVALALASALLARLLGGHSPAQVGAAPVTFRYTSLTGHLTGVVIALTLAAANIGTSRAHGLAALGVLVAAAIARALGLF